MLFVVSTAVVVLHPASATAKPAISRPRTPQTAARRRATLRVSQYIGRLLVAGLNRE
jgi:hypothetical protein